MPGKTLERLGGELVCGNCPEFRESDGPNNIRFCHDYGAVRSADQIPPLSASPGQLVARCRMKIRGDIPGPTEASKHKSG